MTNDHPDRRTIVTAAMPPAGSFEAKRPPYEAMFPRTRYFEVDSVIARARYAVWITTPKSYDEDSLRSFATIYMPDGNWNAALSPDLCDLGEWDLIDPFEATIQVCVGYTERDVDLSIAIRARDLLPPNEPFLPATEDGVKADIAAGLLNEESAALYLQHLRQPAGDRFLAFLTEELHPFIAAHYRVQPDTIGLFGHSYGGLFVAYAALQPATIFRNFGASSPGILPGRSEIFSLYRDAVLGGLGERGLHMTVGRREIDVPGLYRDLVGDGTVEFLELATAAPIAGLAFTSQTIPDESHVTVKPAAIFSFLRRFYLRKD